MMIIDDGNEHLFHQSLTNAVLIISVLVFILLYYILNNPMGKHAPATSNSAFGPLLPARISWFIFESPNLILAVICFVSRDNVTVFKTPNAIFLSLYVAHYINRTILYPLRMKDSKPVPLAVVVAGFSFCTVNGYLQSRNLCQFQRYPSDYLQHFTFLFGVTLFVVGFGINQHSDHILRNLRKPGERGYKIPRGGMFEYVSCAHYFGEAVEWLGFAFAVQSLCGWAFLAFTLSNLIPKAVAQHRWYKETFKAYPTSRHAIIPFLW